MHSFCFFVFFGAPFGLSLLSFLVPEVSHDRGEKDENHDQHPFARATWGSRNVRPRGMDELSVIPAWSLQEKYEKSTIK